MRQNQLRPLFLAIFLFWSLSFESLIGASNVSPRTIKFPSKEVGKITFGKFTQPFLDWQFDKKSLVSAKGNVQVPGDTKVHLKLNWYGTENLDWLQDVRPDDLEVMDFHSMPLTSAGLQKVSRLSGLEHLFLEDTDIVDSDLLSIAKLKNLVGLRISRTGITGKEFRRLSACKNLQQLDASYNKLTDESLSDLRFLPNLRRLDLSRANLTERSMVSLKDLKGIEYFSIKGNREINDKSMRLLPSQQTLLGLDLTGVSITAKAALELKNLKRLTVLRLDAERFGPADRAIFKANLPQCNICYLVARYGLPIEIFRPLH